MKNYKTIDLFAGIGGIRMGFDRAFDNEIDTVFVSEWDPHAQKTYKANFNDDFEIAGAIVCGGMGRERNLVIDKRQTDLTPTTHIKGEINKDGIRKMTPREWARLQGFPDSYKFVVSDTQLYKQFGNSVTLTVVQAIAEEIKEALSNSFTY